MSIKFNGTEIENVIYNGTQLDKVIYDDVVVWEGLVDGSWQKNTYTNTNSGSTGYDTREWTQTFDTEIKPITISFTSNMNRGQRVYLKCYASTDNSTWDLIAEVTSTGGTKSVNVVNPKFYKYFKLSQQNSNWVRDDGNMVFSVEPWRIDYKQRKN